MGLLIEVFWALLMVGIPIGVFTLAIVWWALQRGHFRETLDIKALEREIKAMSKNNKKNKKEENPDLHPVQKQVDKIWWWFLRHCGFFHLYRCRGYRNYHHDHKFWWLYRISKTVGSGCHHQYAGRSINQLYYRHGLASLLDATY